MTTTQSDALGEFCILTKYAAIDARGLGRLPVSVCSRCVLLSACVRVYAGVCWGFLCGAFRACKRGARGRL